MIYYMDMCFHIWTDSQCESNETLVLDANNKDSYLEAKVNGSHTYSGQDGASLWENGTNHHPTLYEDTELGNVSNNTCIIYLVVKKLI